MRKTFWSILAAVLLALCVREQMAAATDNQSHTATYRVSPRGSGVTVGDSVTYDQPAARKVGATTQPDSLLIQYGQFVVDSYPDTIKLYGANGGVPYSVTPTITTMTPIGDYGDTLLAAQVIAVTESTIVFQTRQTVSGSNTIGTRNTGTFDFSAIGPRR